MYADNLAHYSFLQYNQAGPDQGRTALLQYLSFLQRIKNEYIRYSARILHMDFVLTYLHLYRLESTVGNSAVAAGYMNDAQRDWSALTWKNEDAAIAAFKKLNQSLSSSEARFSGKGALSAPAAHRKTDKARAKAR